MEKDRTLDCADCDGNGDGFISVELLGAVPPLYYTVNAGAAQMSASNTFTLSDLSGGDYEIVITDATGCESSVEESIAELTTDITCISNLNVTLGEDCSRA